MSEEEATNVTNQEVVEPEAKVSDETSPNTSQSEKNNKEINFERLRKKNEELERQLQEFRQEYERQKQPPIPPQEEDELNALIDDDIITVSQAKKLAQRQAEELVNKAFQQKERASLPEKTRSKYQDFDNVMTEENIKKFEQLEPGLAEACSKASNPWDTTYKMLKKFVVPSAEEKTTKAEEKAQENLQKPASINSVGKKGPLANANSWSEASKERLYREMMEAARRI